MTDGVDLTGRVALVMGGTRGIGEAIVRRLLDAGADVVTVARTTEETPGRRPVVLKGDVGVKADVDRVVATTLDRFGTVDILVNCAGVIRRKPVSETTEADWDYMVDVNLKGVLLACQAVGPAMRRTGRGRIVNITSIGADLALMNRGVYCATKAGVGQLTRCLALEWGPHGITVNAVGPGITETPLTRGYLEADPGRRQTMIDKIPLRRLGRPDDMAGAVLFLASDLAAYITGQTLYVDGGWGVGDYDW
ncbi:MAG TPA: SDR family NAD(P)-dependent oxidoreductase [Methylomirabilota bacterium]|jgi:NAD(P)-dependent dehydrogenase (short-subunit alcohol dehydrogenase family)|nr:SDR family NAD(P)-dependent oxidoreductase [Methylomirabilota bacterium]